MIEECAAATDNPEVNDFWIHLLSAHFTLHWEAKREIGKTEGMPTGVPFSKSDKIDYYHGMNYTESMSTAKPVPIG